MILIIKVKLICNNNNNLLKVNFQTNKIIINYHHKIESKFFLIKFNNIKKKIKLYHHLIQIIIIFKKMDFILNLICL